MLNRSRKLVVNEREAKIVREIFDHYLNLGSVAELKKHLDLKRIGTKVRTSANGREFGGQRYSRGGLYKLLKNQVYIGKIAHRGETYVGQHAAPMRLLDAGRLPRNKYGSFASCLAVVQLHAYGE